MNTNKTHHTETQILKILRQYKVGSKVRDLCEGVDASELKRLKERENESLKFDLEFCVTP